MNFLKLLAATAAVLTTASAQLQLFEAGPLPSSAVADLPPTATICPTDYPNGFNVLCAAPPAESRGFFLVDGIVSNVEYKQPFFLAENSDTAIKPWSGYRDVTTVVCQLDDSGLTYSSRIIFACADENPPATMYFRAAGAASAQQVRIQHGLTFCPSRDVRSEAFTVFCTAGAASAQATFRVNGVKVGRDTTVPYYLAGDSDGVPNAWRDAPVGQKFTLVCSLGAGVKSVAYGVRIECPEATPTPEPLPEAGSECVIIDARDTQLSAGWVADHLDGVTFNAGNRSKEITRGGVSPLYYTFTVPTTSRYGVQVDMTTRGRADFNDVHLRIMPGGLQLMANGVATRARSWVKGFHSLFARGAKASALVDHKSNRISSGNVLEAGREYTFGISGRSNDVTVHRILLFPCEGLGCQRSPEWRASQERCVPGSTNYMPRPRRS